VTVTITKDRVLEMLRSVRGLTRNEVLIGVPDSNAERAVDPENPTPLSNAAIGYLMETGAPERNLPARPSLVPGVTEVAPVLVERLKKAGNAAILSPGGKQTVDQAMHAVGLLGQNAVRAKITDGPFVALSEVTLVRRRARGRTGTKPLIDSGQFRNAITYVVRPKGKK
jgi:hypothetical protein